jgi:hypothetical protein
MRTKRVVRLVSNSCTQVLIANFTCNTLAVLLALRGGSYLKMHRLPWD